MKTKAKKTTPEKDDARRPDPDAAEAASAKEAGAAETAPTTTEPPAQTGPRPVVAPLVPAQPAADERLLRVMADLDNLRKRTLRERTEAYRQGQADLLRALLSVLDHLDLALAAATADDAPNAVVDGFRIAAEELAGVLGRFGLTPVDAAGQAFDPHRHEAISMMSTADVPEGHVARQVRRGYRLGDKLLRPAQVIVASGPSAAAAEGPDRNQAASDDKG